MKSLSHQICSRHLCTVQCKHLRFKIKCSWSTNLGDSTQALIALYLDNPNSLFSVLAFSAFSNTKKILLELPLQILLELPLQKSESSEQRVAPSGGPSLVVNWRHWDALRNSKHGFFHFYKTAHICMWMQTQSYKCEKRYKFQLTLFPHISSQKHFWSQSLCSLKVVPLLVAPSGWFCHLPSAAQRKVAPGSGKSLAASRIAGQKGGNNWPQRRQELCPWFLIAISAICDIITSGYIPRVEKGNNK